MTNEFQNALLALNRNLVATTRALSELAEALEEMAIAIDKASEADKHEPTLHDEDLWEKK